MKAKVQLVDPGKNALLAGINIQRQKALKSGNTVKSRETCRLVFALLTSVKETS